jgi:rhomboid protease GluP
MCPHCRAFITNKDRVCPYCHENVGARAVDRHDASEMLAGFIPHARFTTVIILLINFAFYAATSLYSMNSGQGNAMDIDGRTLRLFGSKWVAGIAGGQWWRLVTANFLHGGLIHILMNSWVLFDLGASVEEAYGTSRLLVIYFISGIAGFYASAIWSPADSVGASAAIFGLLGAMIALGLRERSSMSDAMRGTYIRWAVLMLILSLFGNIDMAAHVGGLAGGFGVAYLAGTPKVRVWTEKLWRVAAFFCVLITAASFLKWYLWFSSLAQ